ncbi:Hypothetical predicted protein [Pelobates cultripes]|uniref:Uncharacterized protein n=1 Tax=Pelobates cultripes TaxID=61616 RepID=A0AAD1VN54_PELCU|nr:Hypothetical predicted protein [Pelobates cultripes]
MADPPTRSHPPEAGGLTLSDISADIRAIATQMVTKTDLQVLSGNIHALIRLDVTALRTEIIAHGRLQNLEETTQVNAERAVTTNTVVIRQGNMLLALWRQMEDLENRGHRSNIRVRGLPEPPTEEDVEVTLKALF